MLAATGCALLAVGAVATPASAVDSLNCTGGGSLIGTGTDDLTNGKVTVQVCGFRAAHKVTDVRVDYEKSGGDCAQGLDFHWRWANDQGGVKNGDADDQGSFTECSGDDKFYEWHYGSAAVAPISADAPDVVGTLSTPTSTFVTQPVSW